MLHVAQLLSTSPGARNGQMSMTCNSRLPGAGEDALTSVYSSVIYCWGSGCGTTSGQTQQ